MRSIVVVWVVLISGGTAGGCGRAARPAPTDGPGCGCRIEGQGGDEALVMSWGCFCENFSCTFEAYACETAPRTSHPACGMTVAAFVGFGGLEKWVYDQSGTIVGRQMTSDTALFTCPGDPELKALQVRAGRFPEPSCMGVSCGCANGAARCESPDGGAACDCSLQFVPHQQLAMSWDCFCARFGCDREQVLQARPACESDQRIDYPDCGLTRLAGGPSFGLVDPVFDSSGQLVGLSASSDSSSYSCPSDPGLKANSARGGRYPEPACRAVACEPCYTGPFPCPSRDAGARD
jgi:hypothetical protein